MQQYFRAAVQVYFAARAQAAALSGDFFEIDSPRIDNGEIPRNIILPMVDLQVSWVAPSPQTSAKVGSKPPGGRHMTPASGRSA